MNAVRDITSVDDLANALAETNKRLSSAERELAILRASSNVRPGLRLFALDATRQLGEEIAANMNISLSPLKEKYHPDGEVYVRPLENVRRCNVFIIQSLYSDEKESVNDKLCKLFYLAGAVKDASASEVTVVAPYFAYARSDRKVKSREPVITKYLAAQIEAVGVKRLITMDVHSLQAFQNSFASCRTDNLICCFRLVDYFSNKLAVVPPSDIGVMATDKGGVERCEFFREGLIRRLGGGVEMSMLDKRHKKENSDEKYIANVIGDIRPVTIILDDMFATCGTVDLAVKVAHDRGAKQIWIAATHGLFCGGANELLKGNPFIHKIVVSDTVLPYKLDTQLIKDKVEIVSTATLWAEAIRRTYTGESLSDMFNG